MWYVFIFIYIFSLLFSVFCCSPSFTLPLSLSLHSLSLSLSLTHTLSFFLSLLSPPQINIPKATTTASISPRSDAHVQTLDESSFSHTEDSFVQTSDSSTLTHPDDFESEIDVESGGIGVSRQPSSSLSSSLSSSIHHDVDMRERDGEREREGEREKKRRRRSWLDTFIMLPLLFLALFLPSPARSYVKARYSSFPLQGRFTISLSLLAFYVWMSMWLFIVVGDEWARRSTSPCGDKDHIGCATYHPYMT